MGIGSLQDPVEVPKREEASEKGFCKGFYNRA